MWVTFIIMRGILTLDRKVESYIRPSSLFLLLSPSPILVFWMTFNLCGLKLKMYDDLNKEYAYHRKSPNTENSASN